MGFGAEELDVATASRSCDKLKSLKAIKIKKNKLIMVKFLYLVDLN